MAFKDATGVEYFTGVVTKGVPGRQGAKTVLTISNTDTRILHYYCVVHGNFMGNMLTITDEVIPRLPKMFQKCSKIRDDRNSKVSGRNSKVSNRPKFKDFRNSQTKVDSEKRSIFPLTD